MISRGERFTDILPRLQPLHPEASPAELLILYIEPRTLHDKATDAVTAAKRTQELIDSSSKLSEHWRAQQAAAATSDEPETEDTIDDELRQLTVEESEKIVEETGSETEELRRQYLEAAKEAAIGRLALKEQLRLGLRRRLVHALAGAAVSAAIFIPPTYAGIEFINQERAAATTTNDPAWTQGEKVAEALLAAGAVYLGGMTSFLTHGRNAGNRVAQRKVRKKLDGREPDET